MSTTLLYHAFGIRKYKHISTNCRGGAIYFTVRQTPGPLSPGHPGLLGLPDLHRSPGGHQKQNQDHETSGLRLP